PVGKNISDDNRYEQEATRGLIFTVSPTQSVCGFDNNASSVTKRAFLMDRRKSHEDCRYQ
ncbi:MAG: hypothetical protein ACTTK0_06200, partial [Stomatobaculum sp.]